MARNPSLDLYAILGVHPNAEDIVIRAAFKALAQRYHPDRFNGSTEEAHRRMADLTNAYETLADPARRRKYDRRRGHAGRTAMFYFKNPAREHPLRFGALAARAAAAKQRRYRMAVYVLMVAVVILSAFNLHQHSAQLRELFTSNHGIPATTADTTLRNRPDIPPPEAATAFPAPSPTASAARSQPIGPAATTRPIGQSAPENAAQPVPGTQPAAAPEARIPAGATNVPAQPAVDGSSKAPVATLAAPAAVESAHKEAKRPTPRAANVKSAPSDRPIASPAAVDPAASPAAATPRTAPTPVANDAGECKAAVAALGLCNRK